MRNCAYIARQDAGIHTCMSLEIKNGTLHVRYAYDAHKGITKFCLGVDPTRRRERKRVRPKTSWWRMVLEEMEWIAQSWDKAQAKA